MSFVYKIHPGIGFVRVGPSRDGYFLAPERQGESPIDIDQNGAEVAFSGYKDAQHRVRRQGARFRIFEYERVPMRGLVLRREITAEDAEIRWFVRLASSKAAGPLMSSAGHDPDERVRLVVPTSSFRNDPPQGGLPPFTRDDLVASVDLEVSGKNHRPAPHALPMASILRQPFYIGEAHTDASGRLVVLGGTGAARSWEDPPSRLRNFLNNKTWYDDIADGSVDVEITFPGESPRRVEHGSWVIMGPPDFAPMTEPLTSMLDIVEQAMNVPPPSPLTFPQDIAPILRRAANLYWVNEEPVWETLRNHLANIAQLADPSSVNEVYRTQVQQDLLKAEEQISDFRMTRRQKRMLEHWAKGRFQSDEDTARVPDDDGRLLDRASLAKGVGGGFYPGIEAGLMLRNPNIYEEFGRLTREEFEDLIPGEFGDFVTLAPGAITQRMACPWQADFNDCRSDWWPAQRPDIARYNFRHGSITEERTHWAHPTGYENTHEARLSLLENFAALGVIVPVKDAENNVVYAEVDRDPDLDAVS